MLGKDAWQAEVERVAEELNMRRLTEDEAAKRLASLGFDKTEIAEMLKEESLS